MPSASPPPQPSVLSALRRMSTDGGQRLCLRLVWTAKSAKVSSANGTWLSLVERSVRDREAAGSNPVVPTRNRRPEAQSPLAFSVILATNWPQVATNGTSELGKRGLFSRTTRANHFGMFREADGARYQGILRPSSAPFLSTRCPKTKLFAHDTTDCRNGVQADEQRCRNR